jgi:hypothetical protein
MLEGTVSVATHRGLAEGGSRTPRRPAPGARRRDLLARLSAMSLVDLDRRRGGHPAIETEATAVARAWLDLIHSGRSASSWAVAAPALREAIGPEEWCVALGSVRAALGRCHSRRLRRQTTFEAFPGVPPGPYTVTCFESGFEARPEVIETVTTCLGDDGRWRVAAYFVR